MIVKPAVTVLLAAIAIFCCASALAGSVEIGFVDKAGLHRWMAGGPARSSNQRDRLQASEVQQNFTVPDGRDFQSYQPTGTSAAT